jgi:LysM repeat protein
MILDNFFAPQKKSIAEDFNQTTDPKTGQTTQRYSMGPFNAKQTTDARGKVVSRDAEVDVGVGKFATGQTSGITSKAYTPAPGQEGMSGRDLYSMGNADKAATYDRAAAAVNETPMSPRSPALAAPKAPRAPAAPTLEEEDQSVDPDLVNQIYQNNLDVIGSNRNLIKPGQVLSLPDGSSYPVQRGDSLSKIAKKIQTPTVPTVAAPVSPVAIVPPAAPPSIAQSNPTGSSVFDVFPDIGGKIYDLTHPSAIPNGPAVAGHPVGTVVRPDWSQTKYRDLGPLTKNSDGVWRAQNGASAVDPAVIAMAEKLSPVQKAKAAAVQPAKSSPEMVPAADSMAPGEEIIPTSKPKPPVVLPKRVVTPTPKITGIAAAADKAKDVVTKTVQGAEKLEKDAEKAIKKGAEWIGDKFANRAETKGSKDPYSQANNLGSSAYGRYQFMPSTFNGLVKLVGPSDKLYGKTWEDYKNDPALQDETMRVADKYYTNVLFRNKVPLTDGNKYLAHFAGAENAVDMINMPKTTSLKDVYPDRELKDGTTVPHKFFRQNKFPTDMTVGDLRKWADNKMAEPPEKKAKQTTKESAVAKTIQIVKVMLETASTTDDIRHIRNYIDRQYIRHGMLDEVAFAQRSHLIERVIEITNQRRLLAK